MKFNLTIKIEKVQKKTNIVYIYKLKKKKTEFRKKIWGKNLNLGKKIKRNLGMKKIK